MEDLKLAEAIAKGNMNLAIEETNRALEAGVDAQTLIDEHLIVGMEEIGQAFEDGKAFVPNLLMAARAMTSALDILKPLLKADASASRGTIVIGTVAGDLHDIGKNLVASMLEGCGFEVINLGVNVTSDAFVKAAQEHNADAICLSALLTTTMVEMKSTVEALEAASLRDKVKVMIGGAPISHEYAAEIGADGYSANANEAVALARRLMSA